MSGKKAPILLILSLAVCLLPGPIPLVPHHLLHPLHAEQKVYRIGVENQSYLPFYHTTKDGKYEGPAREILDQFAKSRNIRFVYIPLPVNRLFGDYLNQNSKLDFKFPDNPEWQVTPKKKLNIHYSTGILPATDGVIVRKENLGKGDKHLKLLGIIRGFTPTDYLNEFKQGTIQVHENNTILGLLKQVQLKRLDGAYVNLEVAQYLIRQSTGRNNNAPMNDLANLAFDPKLRSTRHQYMISSYKHPKLISSLNMFLSDHQELITQFIKKNGVAHTRR